MEEKLRCGSKLQHRLEMNRKSLSERDRPRGAKQSETTAGKQQFRDDGESISLRAFTTCARTKSTTVKETKRRNDLSCV